MLLLYGNKTSQVVKDVLADIGRLKAVRLDLCACVGAVNAAAPSSASSQSSRMLSGGITMQCGASVCTGGERHASTNQSS